MTIETPLGDFIVDPPREWNAEIRDAIGRGDKRRFAQHALGFNFGTFLFLGGTSAAFVDIVEEWLGLALPELAALLEFLADHGDAVEYDLFHELGVDLLDLGTEGLTFGRLGRLIARLPRESWTSREVGGEQTRWGEQEHLLATAIDVLSHLTYLTRAAHFKGRVDPPKPLLRPGVKDPSHIGGRRSYSREDVDRILAGMRPKAG